MDTLALPEELQFRDVRTQEPVIIAKESRQILPQNGTSFEQGDAGSTQIVFRIPNDENTSTDLSSLWISANLQVRGLPATPFNANCTWLDASAVDTVGPNPAGAYSRPFLAFCDGIESAIRQIAIYVNGSELERHDYHNWQESMLNLHTNHAGFSNSVGCGSMLLNIHPLERCKMLIGNGAASRTESNVIQVCFPLRWTGIANLRSLIPTSLLGGGQSAIEIRLFLANANEFLCAGALNFTTNTTASRYGVPSTFTPITAGLTYRLTDVRANYDVSVTADSYNQALRTYLASSRLTLPIDTYYSTVFDLQNAPGWQNFTISTQMSDVSAVFIGFVRSNEQSSYGFCSTDRFYKPPISEARLQINGKPYPNVNIRLSQNPVLSEAEAYHYLMKALKQNCSLETIGNANQMKDGVKTLVYSTATDQLVPNREKSWLQTTGMHYGVQRVPPPVDGANLQPRRWADMSTPTAALGTIVANDDWTGSDAHFWESPSNFILGFDISKSVYASEYELAGQDLTRSSGLIQVNLKMEYAFNTQTGGATDQYRAIVLVRHKRILDIGLDSSQVIY